MLPIVAKSGVARPRPEWSALPYADKTVQVTVGPDTYQIAAEPGITVTAARTGSRDIRRHKASNYGWQPLFSRARQ